MSEVQQPSSLEEKSLRSFLLYSPKVEPGRVNELVILFHGFGGDAYNSDEMAGLLREKHGYSTYRLDFSTVAGTLEGLVREIKAQLQKIGFGKDFERVHLVGHSMGGLVAMIAIQTWRFDNIGKVVALGTPFKGSKVYRNIDQISPWLRHTLFLRYQSQMTAMVSEKKPKNLKVEIGLIAGNKSYTLDYLLSLGASEKQYEVRKASFRRPNDGSVEVDSALGLRKTAVKDTITVNKNHQELFRGKGMARLISRFLQTGKFSRPSGG